MDTIVVGAGIAGITAARLLQAAGQRVVVLEERMERMNARTATAASARPAEGVWFQRCATCGTAPPRPSPLCRVCQDRTLLWERSQGQGRVVTAPMVTHARSPQLRLVVVKLDEGPLADGWLFAPSPEQACLGARVRLDSVGTSAECTVFELATGPRGPSRGPRP